MQYIRNRNIRWGTVDGRPHLGTNPLQPDIIYRQFPKQFELNLSFMRSQEASEENFAAAQEEFMYLRGHGVNVLGGIATYETDVFGRWRTIIRSPRLEGERPHYRNPAHVPRLFQLGRALLNYYEGARERRRYLADIDGLTQYTIGRPVNTTQPAQLYLHDIEPIVRPIPDPEYNFSPDLSVMHVYHWVRKLPDCEERFRLLSGLSAQASQPGNYFE